MLTEKEKALNAFFERQKSVLVAFSGGADSSLLAATAVAANGEKALAVTLKTELVSDRELKNARETAQTLGISHLVLEKNLLEFPEIGRNQKNRCYMCKKKMLETLIAYAEANGFETIVEGTNGSDVLLSESNQIPRPGYSALMELKREQAEKKNRGENAPQIETPLAEFNISKEEVRVLAARRRLPVADKPSMSCLATRFSYETPLTRERLKTVDRAEKQAEEAGIRQIRIRVHTDAAGRNIARIEIDKAEEPLFFGNENQTLRENLTAFLKQNGFSYVTCDLEGFRSGSMDISGRQEKGRDNDK